MYDEFYNILEELPEHYEEAYEDTEEEALEAKRIKQLKADRLILIKRAAERVRNNSPEGFRPTLTANLADTLKSVKKPYQKLPTSFNEVPTETLEESFIFSLLLNLSKIKPKKTLTLNRKKPYTPTIMENNMIQRTYYIMEEITPDKELSRNQVKTLMAYSKRMRIRGITYFLSHHGYCKYRKAKDGLVRVYRFNNPEALDNTLLHIMMGKYNGGYKNGVFTKEGGKYLLSIDAIRWLETEMGVM